MEYIFRGKWISDDVFSDLKPRNVFHRQFDKLELNCSQYRNRHILFRRQFFINDDFSSAKIFISADDYYKLYINGTFVAQGPAPSYHFQCNYNEINIGKYLIEGKNIIAIHTYYPFVARRN